LYWLSLLASSLLLAVACDRGEQRRVVQIVANADGCTPAAVDLTAGERISFEVANRSTGDRELEGIEGMRLGELKVPAGRTRSIDYTAPAQPGSQKVKCYAPGGPTTIIEVHIAAGETSSPYTTERPPAATVDVSLASYRVTASVASVAAGPIKFVATNTSATDVHELAVLRVRPDGTFENTGEVEDIDPGKSGSVVLALPAGKYELACLIAKGEAGSTVDHYQSGMHIPLEVR
jgi:uncharacterized cupredoxin-like copper-binding protein